MKNKLFTCFMLSISFCWAAESTRIKQMYESILNGSPDRERPKTEELAALLEPLASLPAAEVESLLPLARQCLQSPQLAVRGNGLTLFLAVASRPDGSKLLDPYVDDLGGVAGDVTSPVRHMARSTLSLTTSWPPISTKVIATLAAHLEDKSNSAYEAMTIAASLLKAAPSDPAMVHKVLSVVEKRSDPVLTDGALRQLRLTKTRNPEALTFIGKNLDNTDPRIRESAIEAVSRLDRDVRTRFAAQLGRIAADNKQPQGVRSQAAEALR